MEKMSSFIKECEELDGSENFQAISSLGLENSGQKELKVNFKKFNEGSKKLSKWFGETYRPNAYAK